MTMRELLLKFRDYFFIWTIRLMNMRAVCLTELQRQLNTLVSLSETVNNRDDELS